jgi:hypothetical protein
MLLSSRRFWRLAFRAHGLSLVLACCAIVAHAGDEPAAPTEEDEPVLDAPSLVQPALLSGPGFSVDPHVELRGYMAHFTLDTPFGPLAANSVEILAEREAELPALDALDRATRSGAFARAAGAKFVATGKALSQIVMHPIDTMLGIPAGVARYFGNRLKKIATQAQTLSDRAARTFGTRGNPYPSDEGPMTDARDDDASTKKDKPAKHWYSRVGSEAERELKRQLKYSEVKRELARELGIDPYSGNPYVQERLSSLAWVGTGGNFSAGAALGAVGGAGAVVLSNGGRINDVVWKLSPEDLRARNRDRLRAYCRDELLIRRFLRRGVFSPTLQTGLVDTLDKLQPTGGGDALLELGMTASSELESRFVVNGLRLTANYLGDRAKGGTLRPIGAGLAYVAADGEIVLPLPVDYLSWTSVVGDFFDRSEFRVTNKTVLIGGDASLLARRALTERGWNIVVRAPWLGAPPYARFDEPTSAGDR